MNPFRIQNIIFLVFGAIDFLVNLEISFGKVSYGVAILKSFYVGIACKRKNK